MSNHPDPNTQEVTASSLKKSLGKTVLVTGSAKRIGRTIAEHFARAGWSVAVHYGQSAKSAAETVEHLGQLGVQAYAFRADLADEGQVRSLLPAVNAQMGPVTALINNASLFEHDEAATLDFAKLSAHVLPNLGAPILLAQALYEQLPEGAEGVVVNLLDQKLANLNPDFFSYTMSKAGLAAATVMLAQALAPRVRVIGISPGLTLPSYLQDDQAFSKAHQVSILKRSSDVNDIAATILFAAQNRSMTGANLMVDGGQHLMALPRDISFMEFK